MIRKAQIKFISIIMSILLAVFCIIFAVSFFILQSMNVKSINFNLKQIEENFIYSGHENVQNNSLIVLINIHNDEYVFEKFVSGDKFTDEIVDELITTAIKQPTEFGSVDNFYYRISSDKNPNILVSIDASNILIEFRTIVLNTLTALVLIYISLFLIVWLLSFNVFEPIKESLYKQKQFISNASHELRTPLTIISANADVLKQTNDNPYIHNIKSQTKRLDGLIEDMLTLAKIDEGKVEIASFEFNLSDEITNNALPFDAVAFERGKTLFLTIEPDIIYKGDIQSVKKVVNILLDNAIKHADRNGSINVQLKRENNKIVLSVQNSGSEIPTKDSNKIFERFYRGDQSRSRDSGGSGLGLSIAKSIADQNKWKLYAHSKPKESMTIFVVF